MMVHSAAPLTPTETAPSKPCSLQVRPVGVSTSIDAFYAGKAVLPPLRPWFRAFLSFRLNGSLGQGLGEENTETLLEIAQALGKSIADSDSINPELVELGPLINLPEDVVLTVAPPTLFDLLDLPNPPWGWGLVINPHFWVAYGLPAIKTRLAMRMHGIFVGEIQALEGAARSLWGEGACTSIGCASRRAVSARTR